MVIANNPMIQGARGKLSGVVFYPYGNKTIVASRPTRKKIPLEKQSEAQRNTRLNFQAAAYYAKTIIQDPEKKDYYTRKAKAVGVRSAYSAAIADYMRGLAIESVDMRRYTGQPGGRVSITVRKRDFAAQEVNVTIKTETGEVVERGRAVKAPNGAWVYQNVAAFPGREVVLEMAAVNCNQRVVRKCFAHRLRSVVYNSPLPMSASAAMMLQSH